MSVVICLYLGAKAVYLTHYNAPIDYFTKNIDNLQTENLCYLTQGSAWQSQKQGHDQIQLEYWIQDAKDETMWSRAARLSAGCGSDMLTAFYSECQYGYVVDKASLGVLLDNGFDPVEHYELAAEYGSYYLYLNTSPD